MTELLRIENLTIVPAGSPDLKLVKNVSFSLESGKTTCIVGESGSGKSLTALSVMGLLSTQLQRASGKVIFQGRDLASLDNEQMQSAWRENRHDIPGADDIAQSGANRRLPDRRNAH